MKAGGRRAPLMLAVLAITAGLLAAWLVQRELDGVADRPGSNTPVLVAAQTIEAGTLIDADVAAASVTTIEIPADFVPPDALTDAAELFSMRTVADVPQGGYLTRGMLAGGRDAGRYRLRHGERAISVDVTSAPDDSQPAPGSTVDLLASGVGGAQDTRVLIAGAEVLAVSESAPAAPDSGDPESRPSGPRSRLTIRVAADQLPAVVRADVFARELRAVVR